MWLAYGALCVYASLFHVSQVRAGNGHGVFFDSSANTGQGQRMENTDITIPLEDVTVAFYFYWPSDGPPVSRSSFFSTGSYIADNPSYILSVEPNGKLHWYMNGLGSVTSRPFQWTQGWHYVSVSRIVQSGVVYFGVDGAVHGIQGNAGANSGEQERGLYLGRGYYGPISGTFDELMVTDDARYISDFVPPVVPVTPDGHVVALWHMDEGVEEGTDDAGGQEHTLYFSNEYPPQWSEGFDPIPTPTIVVPAPTPDIHAVPGDADGDGHVDGTDYVVWASHYGQTVHQGPSMGDFDRDESVAGTDYVVWLLHYGK